MKNHKAAARYRWPAAGIVLAGTAVAGEVAAQAIASAAGHHVPAQPILGGLYSPLDGLRWLGSLDGRCLVGPQLAAAFDPAHFLSRAVAHCAEPVADLASSASQAALPWVIGGGVGGAGLAIAGAPQKRGGLPKGRSFAPVLATDGQPAPLVIELGTATGKLRELGHEAGIRRGERVRLVGDDVSRNILVLGGTGSGKSTRILNPFSLQAMKQGCGLLFANVKGDVDVTVRALAKMAGREQDVHVIGVGDGAERFDVLLRRRVTPEMASAYISAMLLLSGNDSSEATFWNAEAANLSRAVLGLLYRFPAHYSLPALYRYIFVEEFRAFINTELVAKLGESINAARASATDDQLGEIEREFRYIDGCRKEIDNFFGKVVVETGKDGKKETFRYGGTTENIRSGVIRQLNQILAKMVVPEIEDAFGTPRADGESGVELECLLDGAIIVINAPLQIYGLSAAAIQTLIKLQFFAMMEERRIRKDWNQSRRVGFIADEYQFLATCAKHGPSDDRAVSVIRDTGGFVLFAAQSLDAITAAIGNQIIAQALLANLTQSILFRTKDVKTLSDTLYILGQTEIEKEQTSEDRQPGSWLARRGKQHSTSMQQVADASLIRRMKKGEALALMEIDGLAADDVIQTTPLYVTEARV